MALKDGPLDIEATKQMLAQPAGDDNVAAAKSLGGENLLHEVASGQYLTADEINRAITQEADETLEETPGRSQVSLTPSGGLTRSGRSGGAQKQGGSADRLLALHHLLQAVNVDGPLRVDEHASWAMLSSQTTLHCAPELGQATDWRDGLRRTHWLHSLRSSP